MHITNPVAGTTVARAGGIPALPAHGARSATPAATLDQVWQLTSRAQGIAANAIHNPKQTSDKQLRLGMDDAREAGRLLKIIAPQSAHQDLARASALAYEGANALNLAATRWTQWWVKQGPVENVQIAAKEAFTAFENVGEILAND